MNLTSAIPFHRTIQELYQFLHLPTIPQAEFLLKSTPLSIREIAFRLGFSEAAHFNRFFKKYHATGVCTSGGNAAYLAVADDRVKAISAVVPWMYEPALAKPFWGKETLEVNHQKSLDAQAHFTATGENWTTLR